MSLLKFATAAHGFVTFANRFSLRAYTDKAVPKGTMEILEMSIPKSATAAHKFVNFMNRFSLRVCTDKDITTGTMEILVNPEDEKEVRALLGPDCMRTAIEELSARAKHHSDYGHAEITT